MRHQPTLVRDLMTRRIHTVGVSTPIEHALEVLTRHRISSVPVLGKRGELVGVLSERDGLSVVFDTTYDDRPSGTVAEYMRAAVHTLHEDATLNHAAKRLRSDYRSLPVVDQDGRLVGILSRHDVLRAYMALVAARRRERLKRRENSPPHGRTGLGL
jgi:CBS domain-containing protein